MIRRIRRVRELPAHVEIVTSDAARRFQRKIRVMQALPIRYHEV